MSESAAESRHVSIDYIREILYRGVVTRGSLGKYLQVPASGQVQLSVKCPVATVPSSQSPVIEPSINTPRVLVWPSPAAPSDDPVEYSPSTAMDAYDGRNGLLDVYYGGKKATVHLPPTDTPLQSFKEAVGGLIGLPASHFDFALGNGALTNEKTEHPLSAYGGFLSYSDEELDAMRPRESVSDYLRSWTTPKRYTLNVKRKAVTVRIRKTPIGQETEAPAAAAPPPKKAPPPLTDETQSSVILSTWAPVVEKMQAEMADLRSQITQHPLSQMSGSDVDALSPRGHTKRQRDTRARFICESLLQTLLKLDGFDVQPDFQASRTARKQGVNRCQQTLDQADELKAEVLAQR